MLCQAQARNKVSLWCAVLLLMCMQTKAGGTSIIIVQRVATSSAAKHGVAASDKALDHCLLESCSEGKPSRVCRPRQERAAARQSRAWLPVKWPWTDAC